MGKYDINFEGRVAIVTGAGAGLGKCYALELARRGAMVVVNDFGVPLDGSGQGTSSPADNVVAEIKAAGGQAVANYDNVSTVEGGQNITAIAMKAFGKVDIVINNAGIVRDKFFAKMEAAEWDAVIGVHLRGAYCVTRPALEVMRQAGYGRIIVTSSGAGLFGNFGQANYASAKLGVVGFMNVLKLEGRKNNININAIAPIATSRMTENIFTPELRELSKPEFVAAIVVYLCSDKCQETGFIYNAGFGMYSRSEIVNGRPVKLGGKEIMPTAEDVMANIDKVNSMENAKPYPNGVSDLFADLTGQP